MAKWNLKGHRTAGAAAAEAHYAGRGFVFVVRGSGIHTALAMVRQLIGQADHQPILLLYESPSWDQVALRAEVETMLQHLNVQVVHVLGEAPPVEGLGTSGSIDLEILVRYLPEEPESQEYFLCGPEPMRQAVVTALQQLGVHRERIHEL